MKKQGENVQQNLFVGDVAFAKIEFQRLSNILERS